ncbi:MAG: hypothetical protein ACRC14_04755 [Paracoccaceae bacterium]
MRERSTRPGRKYAAIPNDMLRDKTLSADARFLLALLMTYSDEWVFNKAHLMEITGFGRDKFERAMGDLRAAEYVEWVQNREENTGKLIGTTWVIRDSRGPENQGVGDTEALKNRHPVKPTPGKTAPKKTYREEDQSVRTLFGSEEPQSDVREAKPEKKPDRFDEFWDECPRKVSKDKAKPAFNKALRKVDAETLVVAMRRYAVLRRGEDPKFTAHPASWLNGERWTDEDVQPPSPTYSKPIPKHETVYR